MRVNGTPQGQKHSDLGGKPGKVPAAGGAGGAAGSSCGSHAVVPADPAAWSLSEAMVTTLTATAVVAVAGWLVIGAVAWCKRGDR